ncbi:MAG TPA: DUF2071 domain-containing protein [Candidatus Obscuribacterales bacterium]
MNYPDLLSERIRQPADGWMTVASRLTHFALITYALPVQALQRLLPDSLRLLEFTIDGKVQGLISMAVFLNQGFHFSRFAPLPHDDFGQTNYRIYVTDPLGDPGIWFLGTSLGSLSYLLPRLCWGMPWHGARYRFDCRYRDGRYERFGIETHSDWGQASIRLQDTAEPMPLLPGFRSLAEQQLLLTHPVTGYFTRPDGRTGCYKIWHPAAELTLGTPEALYFRPLEQAGLLKPIQMQQPHSVLLQHQIPYRIYLPPRTFR